MNFVMSNFVWYSMIRYNIYAFGYVKTRQTQDFYNLYFEFLVNVNAACFESLYMYSWIGHWVKIHVCAWSMHDQYDIKYKTLDHRYNVYIYITSFCYYHNTRLMKNTLLRWTVFFFGDSAQTRKDLLREDKAMRSFFFSIYRQTKWTFKYYINMRWHNYLRFPYVCCMYITYHRIV